jgi:hypothetical protein
MHASVALNSAFVIGLAGYGAAGVGPAVPGLVEPNCQLQSIVAISVQIGDGRCWYCEAHASFPAVHGVCARYWPHHAFRHGSHWPSAGDDYRSTL